MSNVLMASNKGQTTIEDDSMCVSPGGGLASKLEQMKEANGGVSPLNQFPKSPGALNEKSYLDRKHPFTGVPYNAGRQNDSDLVAFAKIQKRVEMKS